MAGFVTRSPAKNAGGPPKTGFRKVKTSIWWNLLLITAGCFVSAFGTKCIIIANKLVTGGVMGAGMLTAYATETLSPIAWYLIFSIPIFIVGWRAVSLRFLLYSLYGTLVLSLCTQLMPADWSQYATFNSPILAALAGGMVCGLGSSIILWSMGSSGGLTILAIACNQKWGIRVGQIEFAINFLLFALCLLRLPPSDVLCSMIVVFTVSQVVGVLQSFSNQRKMVFIVADEPRPIADAIIRNLGRGVTLLDAKGAFTGQKKEMVMTVVHTFQLNRLEEIVVAFDPNAFIIVENTFNVLGSGFSQRKKY